MGARFWTGPFSIGLGIIVGGLVAYGWILFGGFPSDADRYGRVNVPGRQVVTLPAGRLPLDHDDVMSGGGDTRALADAPRAAKADDPSSAQIVIGAEPWTPLGSVAAGAVLCFLVVFAIAAAPGLIARRFVT